MAIEYEDFEIHFEAAGESFQVRVECPAGQKRSIFRLYDTEGEGITPIRGWWLSHLRGRHLTSDASVPELAPQEIGSRLFRLVFRDQILSLFDRSLGIVQGRGAGLRIVLRFDLRDEGIERLSHLPWELFYRKETDEFLALGTQTPVVRHLAAVRPQRLPALRDTPRVLVAIAKPPALEHLKAHEERQNLEQTLNSSGVEIDILDPATRDALVPALRKHNSHILHFIGHGYFEERNGEGGLVFEGAEEGGEPTTGSRLAAALMQVSKLRLVFLNACDTALADGRNPFAGVASALVDRGVPSVLAMQAAIPDDAAITFSRGFYRSLAQGDTLEEAVSRGRAELHERGDVGALWAMPVLFTRVSESVIPRAFSAWLWTILGLASLSLSFNTWSYTQGWHIDVPGIHFAISDTYTAAIYGILWGAPILALLLQATRLYPQSKRGDGLADRLPIAFDLNPAKLSSFRRLYQRFFFFFFLLVPMAAQVHFFNKMTEGTVMDHRTEASMSVWAWVPWEQLLEDHRSRFYYNSGITFYPGVEPWFFLTVELALLVFFVVVCRRLFSRERERRASK
jgi:hypothetical protein